MVITIALTKSLAKGIIFKYFKQSSILLHPAFMVLRARWFFPKVQNKTFAHLGRIFTQRGSTYLIRDTRFALPWSLGKEARAWILGFKAVLKPALSPWAGQEFEGRQVSLSPEVPCLDTHQLPRKEETQHSQISSLDSHFSLPQVGEVEEQVQLSTWRGPLIHLSLFQGR